MENLNRELLKAEGWASKPGRDGHLWRLADRGGGVSTHPHKLGWGILVHVHFGLFPTWLG